MYRVIIEYEDGRKEAVGDDFDSLATAIRDATQLADVLGNAPGDGHGPPQWVQVYQGETLKVSISILRGGLLGQTDENERPAKRRSTH